MRPALVRLVVVLGVLPLPPVTLAAQAARDTTAAKATIRVGGYIQARETYRSDTRLTATLNRARLSADGSLPAGFTYRVLVEYEAGGTATTAASVSLRDAYVRWTRQAFSVTAGQYKTPFSPEYIMSITQVETADRAAVVDSIATKRDIGVMAQYTVGSYGTLAVGIFNGEGQNRIVNVDSSSLIVARVAARPIPFVTLGANIGAYAGDSTRYGVDASAEYRGLLARGEFIWQSRHTTAPVDKGWYGLIGYKVLPWVQLVARQERFERPAITGAVRNIATTGGVNVWFGGDRVRLLANYVSRRIGTPGTRRGSLVTQAQVRF
ncbi:MAG TPA: porin [Gemmatimonadales bacterium]|nr:porin [Gemmatimonadales bacterium]